MNEQQLAAVKQALEALEGVVKNCWRDIPSWRLDEIKERITALQSIIDQDALHKMAEDAVTIGLSYNDWPKIGCVNHDCAKCRSVQEPVAYLFTNVQSGDIESSCNPDHKEGEREMWHREPLVRPPAAPVQEPVAWMQDSIELYVQDRPSAHYTIPLYTTPPAAQPAPVAITTGMALAFHRATSDGSISDAEAKEIKIGLEAAFANITAPPAAQPAPVPLTGEQREEVCIKAEQAMASDPNLSWRIALITQTEAAHGITAAAPEKGGAA